MKRSYVKFKTFNLRGVLGKWVKYFYFYIFVLNSLSGSRTGQIA